MDELLRTAADRAIRSVNELPEGPVAPDAAASARLERSGTLPAARMIPSAISVPRRDSRRL